MTSGRYEQRFTYIAPLGQGGMGRVVRANDRLLGREVALKLVPLGGRDAVQIERFRREGEVAARLDHPGIVKVHTAGVIGQEAYLAYELVEGARPLDEAFRGADRARRLGWVLEASRALAHAHERGVVHRDVKPGNILVDGEGRVRVTDFGLARATGLTPLTRDGALMGTPLWLAPEGFSGQPLDARGDVWALGVILYQALADALPFTGQSLTEIAARVSVGRARTPRELDATVPRPLEDVCLLALRHAAVDRPSHAGAFAELLQGALEGRSPPGARRSGLALAAGVAVLALAAMGAAVLALGRGQDEPEPPTRVALAAPASSADASAPKLGWVREAGERRFSRILFSVDRGGTVNEPLSQYRLELRLQELTRRAEAGRADLTLRALRIKIELRAGAMIGIDDREVEEGHPVKRLVDQPFQVRQVLPAGDVEVEGLTPLREEAVSRSPTGMRQLYDLATEPLTDPVFGAYLHMAWAAAPPRGEVPESGEWRREHGISPWLDKRLVFEAAHRLRELEVTGKADRVRDLPTSGARKPVEARVTELRHRWDRDRRRVEAAVVELAGAEVDGDGQRAPFVWRVEYDLEPQ